MPKTNDPILAALRRGRARGLSDSRKRGLKSSRGDTPPAVDPAPEVPPDTPPAVDPAPIAVSIPDEKIIYSETGDELVIEPETVEAGKRNRTLIDILLRK